MSAGRPRQFLADLAQAMRTTAEAERLATIDRCQANAKAYVEHLNSQTNADAASLQQAAVADISAIREGSRSTVDRVRKETERRITRRQELLETELQEYAAAAEAETERVQQRVQDFEVDLARSFEQLVQVTDPTDFANLAAEMPAPLAFAEPDPAALVHEFHRRRE
jgi:membrane-bound lytic murein transglycosylase